MRISDWSSDVCSSDLVLGHIDAANHHAKRTAGTRAGRPLFRFRDPLVHRTLARLSCRHRRGCTRLFLRAVRSLAVAGGRSEEHTSELQSLMRISYAVFCLKKKNLQNNRATQTKQYRT